ncbi:MBL fold metallo-hydrolase [Altererythrobacter arenosus]|uniref:MBL fold metallo-hydrolase n=1 Tax=Altererythrobacter arenosus TaxID=3032592 RepID=A0ABY8FT18_9SPHN|nr:MBL fold metallo-hydrolase [Altererythrobacter sp. CAU 1644]WFL76221.1 MBL fold metallo-hydrolase [Altererythrobacter sp. CAU 1644]
MSLLAFALAAAGVPADVVPAKCQRELVVLGAGQDAGAPQIGNARDAGPRLLPSSLALIDRTEGKRYLFDATPAITEQLAMLDAIAPPKGGLGIDGIFLTHAHIGHYLGLAWLGREAAGAKGVPVYAMPRMAGFLRSNGPWSQLVELGNISIKAMEPDLPIILAEGSMVAGLRVPHRDEYSETVGFAVTHPYSGKFLYIPDIDSWEEWEMLADDPFPGVIERLDYVFLDATFWDDNELPGRDMSEIPHPRVTETMDMLQDLPPAQRAKVHFIHYNHTNPIRDPASAESRTVTERGFKVARGGDRLCLD